jgi:hypothetical protein
MSEVRIQMFTGDLVYRLFMSFYGLVFPAYVWICMVPLRGRTPGTSRRALTVLVIAIAVAAPMFWLGYVCERMLWLVAGVGVVLLARLMVPGGCQKTEGERRTSNVELPTSK